MYKQKQLVCCGHRRKPRISSRLDKSRKKTLQILQTYVSTPPKSRQNTIYELVEKDKLQALKKRQSNKFLVLSPQTKNYRSRKFQLSDNQDQDKYLEELKNLKSQIKNLQKQVQHKKAQQQYEDQYLSEVKAIKSQIQQLKALQKQMEQKRAQLQEQERYMNNLQNLKSQVRELHQQIKQHKSPTYLPPIHIHPSIHLNPQNIPKIPITRKISKLKTEPSNLNPNQRRSYSVSNQYNDQLDGLKDQLNQLRRQLTLDKKFKKNAPYLLPQISRVQQKNPSVYSSLVNDFANNNFNKPKLLDTISVANPQKPNEQMSQSSQFKMWKEKVRLNGIRKVRKVLNAIFFTYNLQRLSERIKMKRQNFFRDNFQQNIYNQVTLLKDTFVKSTADFIKTLPISEQQLIIIVASDNQKQRQSKIDLTRKYLNNFLDLIRETQFSPQVMQTLAETCYFVCRHGSAGVLSNYFTAQELDIMCISKASLKVSAEKNLEKSQIISFIWVKLIVFNILLRTDSIKQLGLEGNQLWSTNFYLLGSIVYEISRKIQAHFVQKVPLNYIIGNWKHINFLNSKNSISKKAINPSKSMVITLKQMQNTLLVDETQNELIQGTISKIFIAEAYDIDNWDSEQRKIMNYVSLIHRRICKYHAKLKQQIIN